MQAAYLSSPGPTAREESIPLGKYGLDTLIEASDLGLEYGAEVELVVARVLDGLGSGRSFKTPPSRNKSHVPYVCQHVVRPAPHVEPADGDGCGEV